MAAFRRVIAELMTYVHPKAGGKDATRTYEKDMAGGRVTDTVAPASAGNYGRTDTPQVAEQAGNLRGVRERPAEANAADRPKMPSYTGHEVGSVLESSSVVGKTRSASSERAAGVAPVEFAEEVGEK